jgi:hypothetical protein
MNLCPDFLLALPGIGLTIAQVYRIAQVPFAQAQIGRWSGLVSASTAFAKQLSGQKIPGRAMVIAVRQRTQCRTLAERSYSSPVANGIVSWTFPWME